MGNASSSHPHPERTPPHLWVVGLLAVLWNAWGVALAIGAQTDRLQLRDPDMAAYFEGQPLWFVVLADIAPLAGVAGGAALLLQSRWAARLFATQVGVIVLGNTYELIVGTSLLLSNPETRVVSLAIVALTCGLIAYARALTRRGVLY